MTSSRFSSEIERLLQQRARPEHGLDSDEETGLTRSFVILNSNYSEMVEFVVDGFNINQLPVHEAETTVRDIEAQQAEATRLTHNYLSSLYSFNEHVKELVNRKTNGHVEMKRKHFLSFNQRRSDYSRLLTFLWGLRVDFQHGHFSGVKYERYDKRSDTILFRQKFSRKGFVEDTPLDSMNDYLRQTNSNEREYPFVFISRFHNNELDQFYDDCLDWFNGT